MMDEAVVLIVDDEKHTRDGLRMSLEDEFDVYAAANIGEALEVLKAEAVDVMVTDLRLGSEDGMDLVEQALGFPRAPICIMMTAYGSVDTAVEAMKRGAYHFVTKPLNIDELEILIKRALRSREVEDENRSLKRQVEKQYAVSNILGRSAAIEHVLETVEQVAPTKTTVLIEGESGTGKELVAHAIHNLSGRPKSRLVIVHCAALSAQLLESELFGHERGAFTGATEKRIGRFEQANGGTLFLDEIGEIDSGTQVKLLRALGERVIERVGGNDSIAVDVRVVAATNKHLEALVAEGAFREDLYYRLNVVKVVMPPLRERREDIVLLAQAFLKEFAEENGKPYRELSAEAMQALVRYDWPGNVRELRTAIEHGVVMSKGPKITLRHLPEVVRRGEGVGSLRSGAGSGRLSGGSSLNLESAEQAMIERALERTSGNRTEAAQLLGISRRTLQRKLKAFQEEISD
ncbi:MAG: sigma-54 dependent transcriptional regulator [Verrucomicrobiota bacterium]